MSTVFKETKMAKKPKRGKKQEMNAVQPKKKGRK
jgi:hypothetical protein